ncbi:MAG: DoxX family protein, partial [Bacteroidota bacterium]
TGIVELIAGIMLLVRPVSWVGAGLVAGTMMGAITFHLGPLGIDVQGDGGVLFVTGIVTLVLCVIVLVQEKARIMRILKPNAA